MEGLLHGRVPTRKRSPTGKSTWVWLFLLSLIIKTHKCYVVCNVTREIYIIELTKKGL